MGRIILYAPEREETYKLLEEIKAKTKQEVERREPYSFAIPMPSLKIIDEGGERVYEGLDEIKKFLKS